MRRGGVVLIDYLRGMDERIPMTCRVKADTAGIILDLAHDRFNDSLGEAVDLIVAEWSSSLPAAGGAT